MMASKGLICTAGESLIKKHPEFMMLNQCVRASGRERLNFRWRSLRRFDSSKPIMIMGKAVLL